MFDFFGNFDLVTANEGLQADLSPWPDQNFRKNQTFPKITRIFPVIGNFRFLMGIRAQKKGIFPKNSNISENRSNLRGRPVAWISEPQHNEGPDGLIFALCFGLLKRLLNGLADSRDRASAEVRSIFGNVWIFRENALFLSPNPH